MVERTPPVIVRMDDEDRALLEATAAHEKLTMSDIIRRAVREYAKRVGVEQPKPKRRTKK